MANNGIPDKPRRIVVVLDESRPSRMALEAAADLAARRQAELLGLFIEDTDLLRSAGFPFGSEIGLTSGRIRPMKLTDVEHRLKREAEAVRRDLAAIGRRRSIPWQFHVSRGQRNTAPFTTTTPTDLLVLVRQGAGRPSTPRLRNPAAHLISGANCSVMLLGDERPATDQPILVLFDDSESGERALNVAATMARDSNQELTILLPPASPPTAHLETAAKRWAHDHGTRVHFRQLGHTRAQALIGALRREHGQVLVLSRDSQALHSETGRAMLEELSSPVVVVP